MKFLLLFFSTLLFFSCRKDSFITSSDARISITADTLKYDTVFTGVGSVVQSFKVINENDQKLRLSSIKLLGGGSSSYQMNVDGIATAEAYNIEIAANDSVYVFVQVNVDPAAGNNPFILRDSIQVSYNGNDRLVQLEAWGQNAHYLRNTDITVDQSWTNDLPYVILGYLYVHEDTRLTIDKGCRIYVHADAPILVDGTLEVNGDKDTVDRVYFRGDRLDDPYRDFPAAWPGIYFGVGSKDNTLTYTTINNAYQAIAIEGPSITANPKLRLEQVVIDNAFDAGIIGSNTSIVATNCLISNCGKNVLLSMGGDYAFTHCTVVSYSNSFVNHKDPVLTITNFDANNATANLSATFRNCIFWGENGLVENEVVVGKEGASPFSVTFDHNLWKITAAPANINSIQNLDNLTPEFDSIDVSKNYYDFRLKDISPALDAGVATPVNIDLDGRPRPNGIPDLGCFERP